MQGASGTSLPNRLESLLRIPLHELVITAAIDADGHCQPVGGIAQKLAAFRSGTPCGPFLACPAAGEPRPSLHDLPAGSRWVEPGEALEEVLRGLLDVYRLDLASIREACKQRTAMTLAEQGAAPYRQKYDRDRHVRRRALERPVRELLSGRVAPVLFLQAASGQGKTCFVLDLLTRMERSPRVIPLLLRGISVSKEFHQPDLAAILDQLAQAVVGPGDRRGESAIDALDRCLQQGRTRLLLLLDGVNEARDAHAVFDSAWRFITQRVDHGQRTGRGTAFRLIVTSRPERFRTWYSPVLGDALVNKMRPIGHRAPEAWRPTVTVAHLGGFDPAEMADALRAARIGPLDSHLDKLLRDPLLLGFYREAVSAAKAEGFVAPRTPLEVLWGHWQRLRDGLKPAAESTGLVAAQLEAAVQQVCQVLVRNGDVTAEVDWNADTFRILTQTVMVFEETRSTRETGRQVRFRYDRVAELLIAFYGILRDEHGQLRSPQGVVALMVQTVLRATDVAVLGERDVIRGSLVAALQWRLESGEAGDPASTFALAMSLLDEQHPAYGTHASSPNIVKACQLSLGEIVHDFMVQSAPWCGPELTQFLEAWFKAHRGDEHSSGARLLRRVVFNVLLRKELGSKTLQEEALKVSRATLVRLGAGGLLSDTSGDPAVLLHSLHADGQRDTVYAILQASVDQLVGSGRLSWARPSTHHRLQRIGLALVFIAPEALTEVAFLQLLRELFKTLPATGLAIAAASVTDRALRSNDMPVRAEEWDGVGQHVPTFGRALELLTDSGWSSEHGKDGVGVGDILDLALRARNGIVAQLLSTALSARIVRADPRTRALLLQDLERSIDELCRVSTAADISDPSGGRAYLLSLVCYHLIVFDAPLALAASGRPHLPVAEARRLFGLMARLADERLLRPPFLGRFKYRSEAAKLETTNAIGTLGRAALELQDRDFDSAGTFRELVRDKAREFATRDPDFTAFLFDSLATLGTLSRDPALALSSIVETAAILNLPGFAKSLPDSGASQACAPMGEAGRDPARRHSLVTALRQVRTLHPFAVEQFLSDELGTVTAGPLLKELRKDVPVVLSRHLSWVFEDFSERLAIEHPALVGLLSIDVRVRLDLQGLRTVAARSMFRLSDWAHDRQAPGAELSTVPTLLARAAGRLGMFLGPLGALVIRVRSGARRVIAGSRTPSSRSGPTAGPEGRPQAAARRRPAG